MTKTQCNRLLKLATFLKTVPLKNFDIDDMYSDLTVRKNLLKGEPIEGTACAVGWATKLFKKEIDPYIYFGLTFEDICYLFTRAGYKANPRPTTVAKRIEEFVNA